MPIQRVDEASTVELLRDALDEARELARLEVAIAKEELKREVRQAKIAAIGFAISVAAVVLVLSLLGVAIVLALGGTAIVALVVAGGATVLGALGAWLGWSLLPKKPLDEARLRMKVDLRQLKEHVT